VGLSTSAASSADQGRRVRTMRKRVGLSTGAVARHFKVDGSYISLIESGKRPVPPWLSSWLESLNKWLERNPPRRES
jgi:transcriptional regulator with XRE-family HTH domain